MIIMKFGGTSVKDPSMLSRVTKIIKNNKDKDLLVVVSALSGVTDQLERCSRMALEGNPKFKDLLSKIRERHINMVNGSLRENSEKVIERIDRMIGNLSDIYTSINVLGELSKRSSDAILSYGEKLSAVILAEKLGESGLRSKAVNADRVIVTDENFGRARPLIEESRENMGIITGLIENGSVPIVTGFIGSTTDGIVTTLGRGGSDYTATFLANLLDADSVWIWTDVDGVKTADPKATTDALTIDELSYEEAAELSYFGARVLHPKAIDPASVKNIPVLIKNTYNPGGPYTKIRNSKDFDPGIKSVTSISNLSLITVKGHGMVGVPGIASTVFSAVADENINVLMISQSSSEQNISFIIKEKKANRAVEVLQKKLSRELDYENIKSIHTEAPVSIVAAVGTGLREYPGLDSHIFSALAKEKVNVLAIAQGSSDHNISLVVREADEERAVILISRGIDESKLDANKNEEALNYAKK